MSTEAALLSFVLQAVQKFPGAHSFPSPPPCIFGSTQKKLEVSLKYIDLSCPFLGPSAGSAFLLPSPYVIFRVSLRPSATLLTLLRIFFTVLFPLLSVHSPPLPPLTSSPRSPKMYNIKIGHPSRSILNFFPFPVSIGCTWGRTYSRPLKKTREGDRGSNDDDLLIPPPHP